MMAACLSGLDPHRQNVCAWDAELTYRKWVALKSIFLWVLSALNNYLENYLYLYLPNMTVWEKAMGKSGEGAPAHCLAEPVVI